MNKRKAIGDNPLDALVPAGNIPAAVKASKRALAPAGSTPKPAKLAGKERLTVHLPLELIDKVKNAVYWTPGLTLAGLAEEALIVAVAQREKGNGKPFPKRTAELKGGRPMK